MNETYFENRMKKLSEDHDRLIELENEFQPVRDLIKKKKYAEATEACANILSELDSNFMYAYKYIIAKMGSLEPEEFERWLHNPVPYKHYPYSTFVEYNEQDKKLPPLPAIFADEHVYDKIYEGEYDAKSKDTN